MKNKNLISAAAVLFLMAISLFCVSCGNSSTSSKTTTDECTENPSSPNCTTPDDGTESL